MANSARKRSNETNPPCVTPHKISRKIARGKNSNNNSSNSPSTSSVGFHRINQDTNSNQKYEFKDGFITKIFLQNFMTHAKFELEPNAKVNLITGENGAGKSSILQAIVVGLGKTILKHDANWYEYSNTNMIVLEWYYLSIW